MLGPGLNDILYEDEDDDFFSNTLDGLEKDLSILGDCNDNLEDEDISDDGPPRYRRRENPNSWCFYVEHYKLRDDRQFYKDANLRHFLEKDGHLDKIKKSNPKYQGCPLKKYWELYCDAQKGEMLDRNELRDIDLSHYNRMSGAKKLIFVPKPPRRNQNPVFGDDPLGYLKERHPNWKRGDVLREFPALYTKLYKMGEIKKIPR